MDYLFHLPRVRHTVPFIQETPKLTPHPNSEERWRSEGIQIGGPGSARGVLGNWFDKSVILPALLGAKWISN